MARNTIEGQIALIVLTVMAIALTLGLSLSQRVITDLEITQEEEKSAQAFSAAEGGVEEALRILDQGATVPEGYGSTIAGGLGVDNLNIQTQVVGASTEFIYPVSISPGDTVLVWLRDHDENGEVDLNSGYDENSIDVCWEVNAAVEVIYFYRDVNDEISRFAFDPELSRRGGADGNNFSDIGGSCAGLDTGATINDLTTGGKTPLFLVVRPFYEETRIGISGGAEIPIQGHEITSTGEIDKSNEEVISRRLKVFREWESPPSYFYSGITSRNDVTTN